MPPSSPHEGRRGNMSRANEASQHSSPHEGRRGNMSHAKHNGFLFDRQLSSSNPCNESPCHVEFCPSGLPGSFIPSTRHSAPHILDAKRIHPRSPSTEESPSQAPSDEPPLFLRKRPPETTPLTKPASISQPSSNIPSLPRRLIAPDISILRGNPPKVTLIF